MTTTTLIGFFTLSFIVCLAPGPAMLFVIYQGMTKDPRKATAGITGLLAANMIWISLCTFGVATIVQNSPELFRVMKSIGALYLIYLGICAFKNRNIPKIGHTPKGAGGIFPIFLKGFLTSITNPKALMFYIAFLPQFVSGVNPYYRDIILLGICHMMILTLVMGSYGILSNRIACYLENSVFQKILNRVMGVCFIGFGLSLFKLKNA